MEARHLSCREWGSIPIGPEGFSREQADALLAAAADHPAGGKDGSRILVEVNRRLHVRQVVGVLAVPGASLEILPKVDEEQAEQGDDKEQVRHRLVHMLDVALGLDLAAGSEAAMARQDETLLDVLIRLFAQKLLAQVRRGMPRHYVEREDDLRALRGRLDITRQFTVHAARPDRLACRFDSLENDTPLMRVMKACVVMLSRHARGLETQRLLAELRHALDGIADTPVSICHGNASASTAATYAGAACSIWPNCSCCVNGRPPITRPPPRKG
jgi:5-methylcytosine-specific restriction enzyme subunit McrC